MTQRQAATGTRPLKRGIPRSLSLSTPNQLLISAKFGLHLPESAACYALHACTKPTLYLETKSMDEPKTPKFIRLAGEQAEVFDKQSDTDREWFESHEGHVYFRPEIDGEWNEHIMLGNAIPTLEVRGYSKGAAKEFWTAVIDLGRAWDRFERKTGSPPSGMRTRVRINRPATDTTQADLDLPIMKYCLIILHHIGYTKPDSRDSITQVWDDGDLFVEGVDPNNPLGVNYGNKRTPKGFGK